MKKRLLHIAAALGCLATTASAQEAITMYGYISSDSSDWEFKAGLYKMTVQDGTMSKEPVFILGDYNPGAIVCSPLAVYRAQNDLHLITTEIDADWNRGNYHYVVDVATGEIKDKLVVEVGSFYGANLTLSPVDNLLYGVQYIDGENYLCTYNEATLEYTTVMPFEGNDKPIALAISDKGEFYGVNLNSEIIQIDKENKTVDVLFDPGMPYDGTQCMTYDYATGTIYYLYRPNPWEETEKPAGIYVIDVEAKTATLLAETNSFTYVTAFTMSDVIKAGAPESITDMNVFFDKDNLTGTLEMTMPLKDIDGNDLSGAMNYEVQLDSEKILEGTALPGETVQHEVTVSRGTHSLRAFAYYDPQQPSVMIQKAFYAGKDTPSNPENLAFSIDIDGKAHLSWDPVEKGQSNGYLNLENLQYQVTRTDINGNTVSFDPISETSFVDDTDTEYALYSWGVNTICEGVASGVTTTPRIYFGRALEIPYEKSFGSGDIAPFDVWDLNNDQCTWISFSADNSIRYMGYEATEPADDWLVSPALNLKKDVVYDVAYTLCPDSELESIRICAADLSTQEEMTKEIYRNEEFGGPFEPVEVTANFTPSREGRHFLGLHVFSKDVPSGGIVIYRFAIKEHEESGVEGIQVATPEAEYYDVTGLRVMNPAKGQILIRRQGSEVTKVVVR